MDFNFGSFGQQSSPAPNVEEMDTVATVTNRSHKRVKEYTELDDRYLCRRAFSEVSLLESMKYERLQSGCTYNFLTGGDVDALSYLKLVLNQTDLDYVLASTWVMAAADIFQIQEWYNDGRIRHFDLYLGEIFSRQFKVEWRMIKRFYEEHPEAGRVATFRNHSKVFAGCNEKGNFYFGIQTSANINTNPRTENGCIQCSRAIYDFYRQYYDGIKSFD